MNKNLNLTAIPERDALVLMVGKVDVLLKNISNRYTDEFLHPFDAQLLAIKRPDASIVWTKEWRDFEEKILESARLSEKIDKSKNDILSAQLALKNVSLQVNASNDLIKQLFELSELLNNRISKVDNYIASIAYKISAGAASDEELTKLKRDLEAYKSIKDVFLQVLSSIFETDKIFKKAIKVFFEVLYVDNEKYKAELIQHKSIDEFVNYVNEMCATSAKFIGYQSKALAQYSEITKSVDEMCKEKINVIGQMLAQDL